MAERDDDFNFLVASIQRSVAQQRARHAELLAARSPKRGLGLVAHVEATLKAIQGHLTVSTARFASATDDVERDTVLTILRLLNGFLGQMQQANTWVEAVGEQRLSVGALRLIDEAAEVLVGSDSDVVTVPSDYYRYATMWSPFSRILQQLGGGPPAGIFPLVLFHPSQESESLLLQPLLIHELGHSTVARQALVDKVVAQRVGKRSFDRAFSGAASALVRAKSMSRSGARILVERHLRSWLTEYLCDALASAYSGPAYAYAFASLVSAESATELQESHPPTALRIRLILDQLRAWNWSPVMNTGALSVQKWLEYLAASTPTPTEPHHRFLLDVTSQFIKPIRDEAAAAVGTARFDPATFNSQSVELESFLAHRILPAQLLNGLPSDRRSIVLAGWLHVLSSARTEGSEGDEPASLPKALANSELGTFLDKSVEMSSVLEAWRAA